MNETPPDLSEDPDVLEQDIRLLRVMIDSALDRRALGTARACAAILDDRKAKLRAVVRRRVREQPAA